MFDTPTDIFIMGIIFSTILTMAAVLGTSGILGAFSGLFFVLVGVYALTVDIGFGILNNALAFSAIGVGIYLIAEAAFVRYRR